MSPHEITCDTLFTRAEYDVNILAHPVQSELETWQEPWPTVTSIDNSDPVVNWTRGRRNVACIIDRNQGLYRPTTCYGRCTPWGVRDSLILDELTDIDGEVHDSALIADGCVEDTYIIRETRPPRP